MRVIPPLTITDSILTSSTAAEPGTGETAWNAATSYTVGQRVIRTTTHRIYERQVAGTTATAPESDAVNWLDVGPTPRWAMFDLARNSQTVSTSAIVVVLTPGKRTNALGLVGLYGASVRIQMSISGSPVYDQTISLTLRNTTTWREYFYGAFRTRESLVVFDMPLSASAVITITINPTAGQAKCGGVVLGTDQDLGTIIDEPVSDVLNFSKVTRDDFGNATLVKRRNVPTLNYRVLADSSRLDKLREIRDDLDAVPALWSGADDKQTHNFFEALLILGIAKKFSISLHNPDTCRVDLQLEEL